MARKPFENSSGGNIERRGENPAEEHTALTVVEPADREFCDGEACRQQDI
jgi:hypothetical protein